MLFSGSDNRLSGDPSAVVRQFCAAIRSGDKKTVQNISTPELNRRAEDLWERRAIPTHGYENNRRINFSELEQWQFIWGSLAYPDEIGSVSHEISGNKAWVTIVFRNGSDGSVSLVKIDGRWKINSVIGMDGYLRY